MRTYIATPLKRLFEPCLTLWLRSFSSGLRYTLSQSLGCDISVIRYRLLKPCCMHNLNLFLGTRCDVVTSPCDSEPCQNSATCIEDNTIAGYNCRCQPRFSGPYSTTCFTFTLWSSILVESRKVDAQEKGIHL